MTSVRGRRRLHFERSSAAPIVAPLDFSPPPESGDKLSNQPAGPLATKRPIANVLAAAINIPKFSKDDLQQILKTILEARVPTPAPVLASTPIHASALVLALAPVLAPAHAPAPAPALIVAEAPRKKLKARSSNVYREKSHMDYYNFCQQCEDYFATAGATGLTQILFAMSFLRNRISFCWQ